MPSATRPNQSVTFIHGKTIKVVSQLGVTQAESISFIIAEVVSKDQG